MAALHLHRPGGLHLPPPAPPDLQVPKHPAWAQRWVRPPPSRARGWGRCRLAGPGCCRVSLGGTGGDGGQERALPAMPWASGRKGWRGSGAGGLGGRGAERRGRGGWGRWGPCCWQRSGRLRGGPGSGHGGRQDRPCGFGPAGCPLPSPERPPAAPGPCSASVGRSGGICGQGGGSCPRLSPRHPARGPGAPGLSPRGAALPAEVRQGTGAGGGAAGSRPRSAGARASLPEAGAGRWLAAPPWVRVPRGEGGRTGLTFPPCRAVEQSGVTAGWGGVSPAGLEGTRGCPRQRWSPVFPCAPPPSAPPDGSPHGG